MSAGWPAILAAVAIEPGRPLYMPAIPEQGLLLHITSPFLPSRWMWPLRSAHTHGQA